MRITTLAALVAVLATLPPARAAAQEDTPRRDDRWQLTLGNGEYVWDVRPVALRGDSLVVRQADTLRAVPIGRIVELRRIRKSEMRRGEGAAAAAMSALTGADDEVYDLRAAEPADRRRTVQAILAERERGDDD